MSLQGPPAPPWIRPQPTCSASALSAPAPLTHLSRMSPAARGAALADRARLGGTSPALRAGVLPAPAGRRPQVGPLCLESAHLPPPPYKAWPARPQLGGLPGIAALMAALMAGALALALAWGRGLVPLLLLLLLAAPPGAPGLRHSYDCGAEGMQLLVLPPEGRTVRFKVMGECQLTRGPHALAAGGLGSSPYRRDSKRRGPLPRTPIPTPTTQGGGGGRLVPRAASPCRSVHEPPGHCECPPAAPGGRGPLSGRPGAAGGRRGRWVSHQPPPL